MSSKLSPIPKDAFDGESFETTIEHTRCNHPDFVLSNNELTCTKCKAGWMGADIHKLYALFKAQS